MKLNGMSVVAGIPFLLYNASKNKYCKGNKTMIEQLPKAFLERMKTMLGKEYEDFLKSYEAPRQFGLRVNTLKISVEEFLKQSPFHLTKVPWTENGFYYEEADRPARHPYYASGLYYLQEPSAMAPAAILPVEPGDYVLDLCAAPGGKATELGARLKGQGMLVANEISASRAKALLRNIELCGIKNSFITNEVPKNLARVMPEFFDKVLVDAPCSGEGMFRKDMDVAKTWDESRPEFFANLQREIVSNAISMLKPGGLMLYSTCTFASIENEGTISYILENFPEMELLEIPAYEGFSEGNPEWGNGDDTLKRCVRIFPHKMAGEGHFIALLKKKGILYPSESDVAIRKPEKEAWKLLNEFWAPMELPFEKERIEIRNQNVYYLPPASNHYKGIHFVRNGLFLGELKKNRFEPSEPLALALSQEQFPAILNLSSEEERVTRYLRGETLLIEEGEAKVKKGWQLVCVDVHPLGFGKLVNQTLKNKYPAGWRRNS